jgi:ACS family glucarate transporter-like MFS transporter
VWWFWYRDQPSEHAKVNAAEVELIRKGIEEEHDAQQEAVPYIHVVTSANVLLAMMQYAASNITFFISITWLQGYIKDTWGDDLAWAASIPLLAGAVALWMSGYLVTRLHKLGYHTLSRRLPAMAGYTIGAIGLLLTSQTVSSESVWPFITCFTIAIFGVEMTLSPSWAFCMDIGGTRSGAVSAAMNMIGNMGAAVSAVLFPYFVEYITLPYIAEAPGTPAAFFVFAAGVNVAAVIAWIFMNPRRKLKAVSAQALKLRLITFLLLVVTVIGALVYTKFFFEPPEKKEEPTASIVQPFLG